MLHLYNTLTRSEEAFTPAQDNLVRMYACGPTVYAPVHVGNARPFVVFALLSALVIPRRWPQFPGRGLGWFIAATLADRDRLANYPFYPAALGELELRRDNREAAQTHFRAALQLARNGTERRFLERRLRSFLEAAGKTI